MQRLRQLSFSLLLMSLMTLVACGGGDGDLTGGNDGGSTPKPITISLSKSDGDLSGDNDIILSATVKQGSTAVANKLVTFEFTDATFALFSPEAGTAVTNSEGIATITIKATNIAGGVEVTASVSDSDVTDVKLGFTSAGGGPEPEQNIFRLSKSAGDLSGENDLTLSATLMQGGVGVPNRLVTFKLTDPTLAVFLPEAGTAVTDANGVATIMIKATNVAGGVEVTASISDSVAVQLGFTSIGGGAGGADGTPVADSITLFSSSQQLASSGAQEITLTVLAKDASNILMKDVEIDFSSTSGDLKPIPDEDGEVSFKTGVDGKISMKLSTLNNPTNRVITVSASSGLKSDSLDINVVGTTISITGSSSLALADNNKFVIKVLDSDGNGINKANVSLSLTGASTEGGKVADITLPTDILEMDDGGQSTVVVIGDSGGTNTIVAKGVGTLASQAVSVEADSFLFTEFDNSDGDTNLEDGSIPEVFLSNSAEVTLKWRRATEAVEGVRVNFTTTRGKLVPEFSFTDVNGDVKTTITSTNAGKALVTFKGSDVVDSKNIDLSNQLELEFVADTAAKLIAQASPNSIGPNGQTSIISVVVRDPSGNLVKNKEINFEIDDISSGVINPATGVTDSNGTASTIFTSGSVSSLGGVSVKASVIGNVNVNDTAQVTVSDRPLFISLGTGNRVEVLGTTDYVKEFSILVLDANSNPVTNTTLNISARPHAYYKGFWMPTYNGEEFLRWVTAGEGSTQSPGPQLVTPLFKCKNEDLNFDGILDVGEDTNLDAELTPKNLVSAQKSVTTDDDGRAVVRIIYPQSYASWVDVKLIASTKVTGSESSSHTIFTLPVLSEHVTNEDDSPATQGVGTRGPFGYLYGCTNNVADEDLL